MIQTWRIYRISAISHILPHRKSELRAHAANIALLHLIRLYLKENKTLCESPRMHRFIPGHTTGCGWLCVPHAACTILPSRVRPTSATSERPMWVVLWCPPVQQGLPGRPLQRAPVEGRCAAASVGLPPLRRPSRFSSLVLTFSRDG